MATTSKTVALLAAAAASAASGISEPLSPSLSPAPAAATPLRASPSPAAAAAAPPAEWLLDLRTEGRLLLFPRGCVCAGPLAAVGPPPIDGGVTISSDPPSLDVLVLGADVAITDGFVAGQDALEVRCECLTRPHKQPPSDRVTVLLADRLMLRTTVTTPTTPRRVQVTPRGVAAAGCNVLDGVALTVADGGRAVSLRGASSAGPYSRCLRAVSYNNTAPPAAQAAGPRRVVFTAWAVPAPAARVYRHRGSGGRGGDGRGLTADGGAGADATRPPPPACCWWRSRGRTAGSTAPTARGGRCPWRRRRRGGGAGSQSV